VIGLPTASLGAGWAAYTSTTHTARVQAAERHPVTARLITNSEGTEVARQRVQVSWTEKDGSQRTDIARVPTGPRGATMQIWMDSEGSVTEAPIKPENAVGTGWITGASPPARSCPWSPTREPALSMY